MTEPLIHEFSAGLKFQSLERLLSQYKPIYYSLTDGKIFISMIGDGKFQSLEKAPVQANRPHHFLHARMEKLSATVSQSIPVTGKR